MYDDPSFSSILIVKISSLGDIIHTFPVLHELHRRFPNASIDWVVSKELQSIVASHPLVRRAIPFKIDSVQAFFATIGRVRQESYDLLFDFQGNCKSGLVTFLAKSKHKVGFGLRTAREWPNVLATNHRFEISRDCNIRLFNLQLVQRFLGTELSVHDDRIALKISELEKLSLEKILVGKESGVRIMVCPGSKWPNKRVPLNTLRDFLQRIAQALDASFFFIWGSLPEKADCEYLSAVGRSTLVDKLDIPVWQSLIEQMDLMIAVDSSALHLCGTTSTPSFSIFGPTSPSVFKPLGNRHLAIQGRCPYGRSFQKQCPVLRTCPTGACMHHFDAETLFCTFQKWWEEEIREPISLK